FEAAKIALAGFLIPFVFVYHPAVLYKLQVVFEWFGEDRVDSRAMIDIATVTWFEFFWIIAAFTLAMWLIASALAGYDRTRIAPVERLLRVALGGAVLLPQMILAGPAAVLGLALLFISPRLAGRPGAATT
ncbi:MAG: hypothetical protein KI788_17580, partial [Mameliella sp.]|nr:hypothetical protein [Mameliella sp.]